MNNIIVLEQQLETAKNKKYIEHLEEILNDFNKKYFNKSFIIFTKHVETECIKKQNFLGAIKYHKFYIKNNELWCEYEKIDCDYYVNKRGWFNDEKYVTNKNFCINYYTEKISNKENNIKVIVPGFNDKFRKEISNTIFKKTVDYFEKLYQESLDFFNDNFFDCKIKRNGEQIIK